jgi:hypothetical protein
MSGPNGHEAKTELAIREYCASCPREYRLKKAEEDVMELRLEQAKLVGESRTQARNVTIIVAVVGVLGLGVQVLNYLDRHSPSINAQAQPTHQGDK